MADVQNEIIAEIVADLLVRFATLNPHYEAAWTDSFVHLRCWHAHLTPVEAAECAMPHGAGWYVLAVEDTPRGLTEAEEKAVNEFRFRQRRFGKLTGEA